MVEAADRRMPAASGTKRLADAVRSAKIAAAHRSDVVVDIREADRARLEIFIDELRQVIEAVPVEDEFFDFALAGGPQPRFWVDGTAHVMMARDRRTYRFLRETRVGRVVLAESTEPRAIADRVTDYVAERIVERDRALAGYDGYGGVLDDRVSDAAAKAQEAPALTVPVRAPARTGIAAALSWLLLGVLAGAGLVYALLVFEIIRLG